jgi:hypothetical protein
MRTIEQVRAANYIIFLPIRQVTSMDLDSVTIDITAKTSAAVSLSKLTDVQLYLTNVVFAYSFCQLVCLNLQVSLHYSNIF